jgi:hypothetical protein
MAAAGSHTIKKSAASTHGDLRLRFEARADSIAGDASERGLPATVELSSSESRIPVAAESVDASRKVICFRSNKLFEGSHS